MKNQILRVIIGIMILPIAVMAQEHTSHDMNMNMDMNHENAQVKHFDVSTDFQKQLNAVYQVSLKLNKAFVGDNATEAKKLANEMAEKMSEVNMSLLKGDAHMAWMMYSKHISEGLNEIKASDNLEDQRTSYSMVSNGLYKAVKSFSIGETVYYQYCPMKKSSWLSNSTKIENPYLGSKMLTCGSTKETLN